jgi:hypothetical protein
MRLAVEQMAQRLNAQRPRHEIGDAPLGIGDAPRPAAWIARASFREAPARVARARAREIRNKSLRLLDSIPRMQVIAGGHRRIGNDFRHRQGSKRARGWIWVHDMFLSREPQPEHVPGSEVSI